MCILFSGPLPPRARTLPGNPCGTRWIPGPAGPLPFTRRNAPQGSAPSGPAGRQMGHSPVLYPGVAQLVARLLWEQDAAGSNPVTRTSPSVHMGTRIFYLAKCRYKHPYQAEPGRNLRSGLGFFFCPFARAYSVQLSFHLDQRQAAAPQS